MACQSLPRITQKEKVISLISIVVLKYRSASHSGPRLIKDILRSIRCTTKHPYIAMFHGLPIITKDNTKREGILLFPLWSVLKYRSASHSEPQLIKDK